jgi:CheY-like chemotaxis protein
MTAMEAYSWILLVDDDEHLRETVAELLELEGYVVREAQNGQEALDVLRACEGGAWPSMILLDLMMPVMDGFEFRARQLRDPRLAPIPVVIFSASGEAQARVTQLKASAGIEKPVRLADLMRTIEQHCSQRSKT